MSGKAMSKKGKLTTRKFDVTEYLDSQEAIAEYLTAMIEDGDPSMLAVALGDVARAKGMAEVAKASGLTREALYKALRQDAQPRFDTVNRVCLALGVKLVVQPQ
jgi:probable addiction module antidote protein